MAHVRAYARRALRVRLCIRRRLRWRARATLIAFRRRLHAGPRRAPQRARAAARALLHQPAGHAQRLGEPHRRGRAALGTHLHMAPVLCNRV
jgi:hypothetical protein